jgi:DNA processing protein
VGSRLSSIQGRLTSEKLSIELASRGVTIVSGMARGIDTAAHNGALRAKGRTIAVIGSGLDVVYPPENKGLMEDISKNGAAISEFPLGTKPNKENFPRRNRVISGLSLGILVVEAGDKSGALITANFALEQGREVFAVPGDVNLPTTKGCHVLIKDGAKLVEKAEDIMEELDIEYKGPKERSGNMPLSGKESDIYDFIKNEPVYIDELSDFLKLEPYETSQILVKLEIRGLIKQLPGKLFIRR